MCGNPAFVFYVKTAGHCDVIHVTPANKELPVQRTKLRRISVMYTVVCSSDRVKEFKVRKLFQREGDSSLEIAT